MIYVVVVCLLDGGPEEDGFFILNFRFLFFSLPRTLRHDDDNNIIKGRWRRRPPPPATPLLLLGSRSRTRAPDNHQAAGAAVVAAPVPHAVRPCAAHAKALGGNVRVGLRVTREARGARQLRTAAARLGKPADAITVAPPRRPVVLVGAGEGVRHLVQQHLVDLEARYLPQRPLVELDNDPGPVLAPDASALLVLLCCL